MTCGQCNSPITAQWAKGKSGGIYRYYRCTKKRGTCSQKYIQEKDLAKKEDLLKAKVSLAKKKDNGRTTKNPLEPLRLWILDTKKASFLAFSDNYHEMKQIIQKIGTNPKLSDRSLSFSFIPPSDFLASRLAGRAPTIPFAPLVRPDFGLSEAECSSLSGCWELNPV